MRVTLGDRFFDAVDWSLGGCRLEGFSTDLPAPGSAHKLYCTLPFQGFNITLEAKAEVVRTDKNEGQVAFRFVELGERETALMQHFIEDLVRGKMTDVADTIVRIDTPVTPVPLKPDPNPTNAMPVRRWPVKQICMTLFYFVLGILVFGYVGVYVFAALFRLEVTSAVVSAERVAVRAPVTGAVSKAPQRTGTYVKAGAVLAVIEDSSHEDAVRRARANLASTRAAIAENRALLAEERRRADGYALVARNNVRQAETQLEGLELARDNARLKVARMRQLSEKGLVRADDLEAAELELKSVVSNLERKRIHIKELQELIDGGDAVRLFTGNAFAGRLGELEARIARLTAELSHLEDVLSELDSRDTQRSVRAPFDAQIHDAILLEGGTVKQGEPLLVLEETGAEKVTAFLTQEEVLQIRVGSSAHLFMTSENRWVEAVVESIDRTAGFVDEVSETHRFRAPDARSANVTLTPVDDALLSSGMPVTVYFERHRNNFVWRISQQFAEQL